MEAIKASLKKVFAPIISKYPDIMGYRKFGLRYDDLLYESESVTEALRRLDKHESYYRCFRIKRAQQLDLCNKFLPESEWTKPEEDYRYLWPIVQQVEKEMAEKEYLDNLRIK